MQNRGKLRARTRQRSAVQGGFALIELTVAILIAGILSVMAASRVQEVFDDAVAEATGVYLDVLASAGQKYILINYVVLAAGGDVADTANDLNPTRTELIAQGRLAAGFPAFTPSQQAASLTITRSGCPGLSCVITANACLTTPFQIRGRDREDGATAVMMSMGGKGGRSHFDAPGTIRGANLNFANPQGAVAGIVCGQSTVDAGFYDSFVKMNDPRDPNLRGGMTLSGALPTGEAMRVNGEIAVLDPVTGNVCVRVQEEGVLSINCQGRLNATTGVFTGPGGSVSIGVAGSGTSYAVSTDGRIRGELGFWSAVGSVFGDNTLGVRAAGTFTIQAGGGSENSVAVHEGGRLGARQSTATPLLGMTSSVTLGTACTPSALVGQTDATPTAASVVLAATSGGGLAVCDAATNRWVALGRTSSVAVGGACSPEGATSVNASGVMLICNANVWISLLDRMGYMIAAQSFVASDGAVIPKPVCGPGSGAPLLFMAPGNERQNIQIVNRYAEDSAPHWTVRIRNQSGAVVQGDVLVVSYCTY